MSIRRWAATAILMFSLPVFVASPALAQEFPSRPIRVVLPLGGGGADAMVRQLVNKIRERTGWTMLVENRAGADYSPGVLAITNSPADGHTVLFGFLSFVLVPHLRKNLQWSLDELTPVARIASSPSIIGMYPGVPASNLTELIAYSKANPGKLSFGGPPLGATGHLSAELLRMATGLDFTYVPYKDTNSTVPDLLAGRIQLGYNGVPDFVEPIRNGRLKGLVVMGDHRSPLLPDVPTAIEAAGKPELDLASWFGFFVRAGTPPAILSRLECEIMGAADTKEVRDYMVKVGQEPLAVMEGAEAFRKRIEFDSERWGRVIKQANVPVQ